MNLLTSIPQFTKSANHNVTVDWRYLEDTIENYAEKGTPGYMFDMDPDFQRGHVWTEAQQVRYVEFILKGGKSSRDIQWNCAGWMDDFRGPMLLVDGKQRVEAVRKFMRNELAIFGGYTLSQIDENTFRRCHASFTFHVNDLKTRAEVLQWYLDLNGGGVVHTAEELNRVKELLKAEHA